MKQYDKLDLTSDDFENAVIKNRFISDTSGEYIIISNTDATSSTEVEAIIQEQEMLSGTDMIVFCENGPDGESYIDMVMACCSMAIFAIAFRRRSLSVSGHFNRRLEAKNSLEFILRVMEKNRVLFIPCVSENHKENNNGIETAYSYMLVKYMTMFKNKGTLEWVFDEVVSYLKINGNIDLFNNKIGSMISDKSEWNDIARDTAPFFIISGNDICYGVLCDFAERLADALALRGEAVVTSNKRYGESEIPQNDMIYKAVIGFQAPVLKNEYMKNINGIRLQYWFDNPACFRNEWDYIKDNCFMLTCDKYYADFVNEYYNTENALHFPPAGIDAGMYENFSRPYDIVFIGTYYVPEVSDKIIKGFPDDIRNFAAVLETYFMDNPDEPYVRGFNRVIKSMGIVADKDEIREFLYIFQPVLQKVLGIYRRNILIKLIEAGYEIHVYGNSWEKFPDEYKHGLIIHDLVSPQRSLEEYGRAKIGLNIMTWHKAGMTERIANIMLSGAVCVSEETEYLTENFKKHEEIEMFKLSEIDKLPDIIKNILDIDNYRKDISSRAYERARKEHTWNTRAGEIVKLTDFLYGFT